MTSLRKHAEQMTRDERLFFLQQVFNKEWIMGKHVRDRIQERGGTEATVLETINYGELIEYHQKDGHSRLLLRSDRPIYKWTACVVIEILSSRVITIYWNHERDDHRTIDMSIYDEDLDIISLFKEELLNEEF